MSWQERSTGVCLRWSILTSNLNNQVNVLSINAKLNFPYVKTRILAQANFYGAFRDPERSNTLSYGLCFLFLVNVTEFLPCCKVIDAPQGTAVTESEALCISSWPHECRLQWHQDSAGDLLWAGDGAEVLDFTISWGIFRKPADCPKACKDKWFIIISSRMWKSLLRYVSWFHIK